MSILKTCEHGWIISHLEYINDIYTKVLYKNKLCQLKFKSELFDINSQYIRQNQLSKINSDNLQTLGKSKKCKKKNKSTDVPGNLEDIEFVNSIYEKLMTDESIKDLFKNINDADNNQRARKASIKFYGNSSSIRSNQFYGCNKLNTSIINSFDQMDYIFPTNCSFYQYDIEEMHNKIELVNQFNFILMDPPWFNKFIKRNKSKSYNVINNENLLLMPIDKILKTDGGIVAIWCTNNPNHFNYILNVMFPKWKIQFVAKWFWLKITTSGKPICDFSYQLSGKQPFEMIIFGVLGADLPPAIPDKKLIISTPSAIHSHKPPILELLKSHLPENPNCLEIFARYLLPNWTSWGLEVLKLQTLELYDICENGQELLNK